MTEPADPQPAGGGDHAASKLPRSRMVRLTLWKPRGLRRAFRRRYGAGPLHLLTLLAAFALAGYVVDRVSTVNDPIGIGVWFVCALVAHDLALFPLYSLADRSLSLRSRRHPERLPRVPWINHLRIPALISGVLLLVSFPLVFRIDRSDYHSATGLQPTPYLARWLLITGVFFAASAIAYAIRVGAHRTATPD